MNIKEVLRESYKGKSIARILMNLEIKKRVNLSGIVVDMGGGLVPSYWRYIKKEPNTKVVKIDINKNSEPNIIASLEEELPIKDILADYVLLFNVLEHIYKHILLILETYRVLKPGGVLFCYVPFLHQAHGDPYDYFRYTDYALLRMLKNAGFENIDIVKHSGLFISGVDLFGILWRFGVVRVIVTALSFCLDFVFNMLTKDKFKDSYVLGYFIKGTKN
jgi:SAM-dependent methyltransferase